MTVRLAVREIYFRGRTLIPVGKFVAIDNRVGVNEQMPYPK